MAERTSFDRQAEALELQRLNAQYPFDEINKAKHYNLHPSGVECIEIIEHFEFNIGQVVKYAWRAGLKDSESKLKDLQKCLYYAKRAVEKEEKRIKSERDANELAASNASVRKVAER
jgi:hypothetical protein